LNQNNLNSLQQSFLAIVLRRHREDQQELDTIKFEQNLFINNPELYKKYMDNKEEQEINGNEGIQWAAPTSIEEAAELMDIFKDVDRQLKEAAENPVEDNTPTLSFLDVLGGINMDEIGGDD